MNIACSLVLILAFCAQARAQQVPASTGTVIAAPVPKKRTPRKKAAPVPIQVQTAAPATGQAATAPAPAAAQAVQKAAVPAAPKAAKKAPPVEEEEPGAVMIDTRSDEDRAGRFTGGEAGGEAEIEEPAAPAGMPASYGQLKGALNDAGRSLLVFENADGEITFVQVFIGKSAVTWRTISNIRRGGGEASAD